MNHAPIHILRVEDNASDARLIIEALAAIHTLATHVKQVERLSLALEAFAKAPIDVILLDLSLPDAQGESTSDRMYTAVQDIPIIGIAGLNDEDFAVKRIGCKRVQDYRAASCA